MAGVRFPTEAKKCSLLLSNQIGSGAYPASYTESTGARSSPTSGSIRKSRREQETNNKLRVRRHFARIYCRRFRGACCHHLRLHTYISDEYTVCIIRICFLLGLLFDPEDGSIIFLQNVGVLLEYMRSYPST
jgi:hypothetical protein